MDCHAESQPFTTLKTKKITLNITAKCVLINSTKSEKEMLTKNCGKKSSPI